MLNLCDCGGRLLVRYDLENLRRSWNRDQVAEGPNSMWRYAPVGRLLPGGFLAHVSKGAPYTHFYFAIEPLDGKRVY